MYLELSILVLVGSALGWVLNKGMRRPKLVVGLGVAFICCMGWTVYARLSTTGFIHLNVVNPKSDELEQAFAMFEKETGKSRNVMTYWEIADYTEKVRRR